jgi:hypothetical protein
VWMVQVRIAAVLHLPARVARNRSRSPKSRRAADAFRPAAVRVGQEAADGQRVSGTTAARV